MEDTLAWSRTNRGRIAEVLEDLFLAADDRSHPFATWIGLASEIGWPEHIPRLGGLYDSELIPLIAELLSQASFIPGSVDVAPLEELRERTKKPGELAAIIRSVPNELHLLQAAYVAAALIRGPYHEIAAAKIARRADIVHHPMRRLVLPDADETVVSFPVSNAAEYLCRIALNGALMEATAKTRLDRYVANVRSVRTHLYEHRRLRHTLREPQAVEDDAVKLAVETAREAGIGAHARWMEHALATPTALLAGVLTTFVLQQIPLEQYSEGGLGALVPGYSLGRRATARVLDAPSRVARLARRGAGRLVPGWIRKASL
jgi:hypothetical protein